MNILLLDKNVYVVLIYVVNQLYLEQKLAELCELPASIMTPQYTYIPSTDFIKSLTFDCIETYSFQRGSEFEENKKLIQAEYDRLKILKEKLPALSTEEEEKLLALDGLLGVTQYLINDKEQFHPSSQRTNIFKYNDPNINRIKTILQTEINEI